MKLNALERITLLQILPTKGDVITLRIIRDLSSALGFTEDEHKALNFTQDGEIIKWDPSKDVPKDVPFGEVARKTVTDLFKKLDKAKEMTMVQLNLSDRFEKESEGA